MGKNVKYRIITDSGCDISKEDEQLYQIDIIPFNIVIDEQEYWERIDVTPHEFYDLANQSQSIPKTSQITTIRFEEKFLECAEAGYEDIIVVLINSTGSQTFNNALIAKESLEESGKLGKMKIHLIDSHCYSIGYGYPIIEAAKKLSAGQTIHNVLGYLEDWFKCVEIYIVGFDLRHMKKSGRISAAAAFLGELMGLRPIISLIDGESRVLKKVRGDKPAVEEAIKIISQSAVPETPWCVLKTTVPELESLFIKGYGKRVGSHLSLECYSGGVVTSNAGTKFIGIVVKGEPRR